MNPTDSSSRPSSSSKRKDSLEVQQNLKRQKFHDDISLEESDLHEEHISNEDGFQQSAVHCATVESTVDASNFNGITQGDSAVSRELNGKGIRNEQDFENLICIEIFSGSGRLTAAIRKLGMRAVAVDRSAQRTKGPVTILDLTKPDDLRYLLNFIESEKDNIMLVHLAPPCGTASAARNRRHKHLEEAGFVLPVPLRSKEFPMGLPTLRGLDLTKVSLANDLYWATLAIAEKCIQLNITVSIENPENSLFWLTEPIQRLFQICPGNLNVFDSCMMGGDRDKATAWWCSDDLFSSLNLRCNKQHTHKPWTPIASSGGLKFPTAEEASYPELLCERVAFLVKEKATSLGYENFHSLVEQSKQKTSAALQHVNMGFLPRGQKVKPLVSEFGGYKIFVVPPSHNDGHIVTAVEQLPKGAKVVQRKLVKWGDMRVCNYDECLATGMDDDDKVEKITVGVPREPIDFVAAAIKAGHPRFLDYKSIDSIDNLVQRNIDIDAVSLVRDRLAYLRRWTKRAAELKQEESELHSKLDPHCKAVLRGKRLLLFGEMLKDINYPDGHLISDICQGFRITGWVRDSGCFVKLPKQPSMTLKQLLGAAKGLNEAVLAKSAGTENSDLMNAAWNETLEELKKEWIWQDDSKTFEGLSLTHRFGLQQKKKVRVIDNFKTSGINATCGMPEKQKLYGLDFLATTLVRSFTIEQGVAKFGMKGKTFDLSSAYKQFPVHQDDRRIIRIAVPVPDKHQCQVFGLNALPFGATGSVAGFLRVSTAVFHLLTLGLGVWAGTFFDDFPILSRADVAQQTEDHVSLLLDLIGLKFSKEGKKWLPFDESMAVLGVILDLNRFKDGTVSFAHTESRRAELDETLSNHLKTNSMTAKEAESLRGRLIWFDSFLFGRVANLSLHEIGKRATNVGHQCALGPDLKRALVFFRDRIVNGPPIEISRSVGETFYLFTDGAFEPDSPTPGTIGGVLYSECGVALRFFSEIVPSELMQCYTRDSKNPIYLIELLATLVALKLWGEECKQRFIVSFIDNEASRAALIKAWSDSIHANNILRLYVDDEMLHGWKPWFGRVPSHSNPADDPSRLIIEKLLHAGVIHDTFDWNLILSKLVDAAHVGELG